MEDKKKSYLRRLGLSLSWRLPPSEVHGVLADYQHFFDDRAALGQTEEEIISALGAPGVTARTIARESGKSQGLWLLCLPWTALAVLFTLPRSWNGRFLYINPLFHYAVLFFLLPVLFLCWRKMLAGSHVLEAGTKKGLLAFCGIGVLAELLFLFSSYTCFATYFDFRPFILGFDQLWLIWKLISTAGYALSALFFLITLIRSWTRSPWYFLAAGCMLGLMTGIGQSIQMILAYDLRDDTGVRVVPSIGGLRNVCLVCLAVGLFWPVLIALLDWKRGTGRGRAA